ncbi:hypothetical protein [Nocardia sp. NRRL S-836]|uniref:hypothetical protein n=1 Tax=Nocardia sp. NRRL S-836 TaxID=1519492 RepID=UPI000A52DD74|nr:hypothetical protein [Nocardia sp. NRRL S-836]
MTVRDGFRFDLFDTPGFECTARFDAQQENAFHIAAQRIRTLALASGSGSS